jgi:hypothetical protein
LEEDVLTLDSQIQQNVALIDEISNSVDYNSYSISINTINIATNSERISINSTDILGNTTEIASLQTRIDDLQGTVDGADLSNFVTMDSFVKAGDILSLLQEINKDINLYKSYTTTFREAYREKCIYESLFATSSKTFIISEYASIPNFYSCFSAIIIPPHRNTFTISIKLDYNEDNFNNDFINNNHYKFDSVIEGFEDYSLNYEDPTTFEQIFYVVPSSQYKMFTILDSEDSSPYKSLGIYRVNLLNFTYELERNIEFNHPLPLGSAQCQFRTDYEYPLICCFSNLVFEAEEGVKVDIEIDFEEKLLSYAMVNIIDDWNYLTSILLNKIVVRAMEIPIEDPIVQDFLILKQQLMLQQNTIYNMQISGIYYVKEYAPSIDPFNVQSNTWGLLDPGQKCNANWDHDSDVTYTGSVWQTPTIDSYTSSYSNDSLTVTVTVYTSGTDVSSYGRVAMTDTGKNVNCMIDTGYSMTSHLYFQYTITGRTTQGSFVNVTPITLLTNDPDASQFQLNFETTVNSDGTFSSVANTIVKTYTKSGDRAQVFEEISDTSGFTTLSDGFATFEFRTNPAKSCTFKTFENSNWHTVMGDFVWEFSVPQQPQVTYIRAPLDYLDPVYDSDELALYARAANDFVKNVQQDVQLKSLDYRMEELQRLIKPTVFGNIGSLFSTASIFMGSAKLALQFERISNLFFTAELISQGRYIQALTSFGGAATGRLVDKTRKGYQLQDTNDVVGSMGRMIRDFKNAKKWQDLAQNYNTAPFDLQTTQDNFVARIGQPIKELPGSQSISNALLNIPEDDPSYKRYNDLIASGYLPEHQAVCIQTHFTTTADDYVFHMRAGIAEGAVSHNGQLGVSSLGTGNSFISNPGVCFYLRRAEDDVQLSTYAHTGTEEDYLLEKKALMAMNGKDREEFKDIQTASELDLYDDRTIGQLQRKLFYNMNVSSVRTIEKSYRSFDVQEVSDIVNSFSGGAYYKNWQYSVPNRTCQPFAKALYKNILTGEDSTYLPEKIEFSSKHSDATITEDQMFEHVRIMYTEIVYGAISTPAFFKCPII